MVRFLLTARLGVPVVLCAQSTQNKHASHAAGTAFEQKILAQPKNVKFNFLHTTDPYHKYYQYKITEVKDGPDAAKAQFQASNSSTAAQPAEAAPQAEEEAPPPTQELKRPDDEKYTAHIPAGLSPQVHTPSFLATALHILQRPWLFTRYSCQCARWDVTLPHIAVLQTVVC